MRVGEPAKGDEASTRPQAQGGRKRKGKSAPKHGEEIVVRDKLFDRSLTSMCAMNKGIPLAGARLKIASDADCRQRNPPNQEWTTRSGRPS